MTSHLAYPVAFHHNTNTNPRNTLTPYVPKEDVVEPTHQYLAHIPLVYNRPHTTHTKFVQFIENSPLGKASYKSPPLYACKQDYYQPYPHLPHPYLPYIQSSPVQSKSRLYIEPPLYPLLRLIAGILQLKSAKRTTPTKFISSEGTPTLSFVASFVAHAGDRASS